MSVVKVTSQASATGVSSACHSTKLPPRSVNRASAKALLVDPFRRKIFSFCLQCNSQPMRSAALQHSPVICAATSGLSLSTLPCYMFFLAFAPVPLGLLGEAHIVLMTLSKRQEHAAHFSYRSIFPACRQTGKLAWTKLASSVLDSCQSISIVAHLCSHASSLEARALSMVPERLCHSWAGNYNAFHGDILDSGGTSTFVGLLPA